MANQRKRRRVIIPPLAAALLLVGCGGGDKCKRACRKMETCLAQSKTQNKTSDDAPAPAGYFSMNVGCGSESTECTAQAECQAQCILSTSCDQLLSGSAEMVGCLAQCAQIDTPRNNVKVDSGILAPIGHDSGPGCTPSCMGRQCGDDGCGGSCGSCAYNETCSYGYCVSGCTPSCSGKQCGDDGCGGSCGSCAYNETCDAWGVCQSTSSSTNSGSLCSATTSCSSGEDCLTFDQNPSTGMCLGKCQTSGDLCGSGSGELAVCALTTQSGTGQYYCAFICEIQGQTYSCPGSYGYTCKAVDPAQPDVKLCIPN